MGSCIIIISHLISYLKIEAFGGKVKGRGGDLYGKKKKLWQLFPKRSPVYLLSRLLCLSPDISAQDSLDVPPIPEFDKHLFSLSSAETNYERTEGFSVWEAMSIKESEM